MKKLYRRIDANAYFIEDVFFDTDTEGGLPANYIETKITKPFVKAKWNGSEWVEGGGLDALKDVKKQEITKQSVIYQEKNVIIDNIEFFGGEEWGKKYRDIWQVSKNSWKAPTTSGWVEVTEAQITSAYTQIGENVINGAYKRDTYFKEIEAATTEEELNNIVWTE